ncbi:MAG: glycosyltransferase [Clostridia bacterium]|nr:glycosyltransferase [Clostridia bacterium]
MKILFINSVCGIGSTGRICAELAEQLTAQGHTVKIAYGRQEYVPEEYAGFGVKIGNNYGVKAHALLTRLTDRHGFFSKSATRKFLHWADDFDPDVLWLHNLHGYYVNVKLLFDWIKSRPQMQVKWTLHDCWAFTGHCTHFDAVGCQKWKTQCTHCPEKTSYPGSMLLDRSAKNFKDKHDIFTGVKNMTLVSPSHWLASLVEQSFLKEYAVRVVHNGIDLSLFTPSPGAFKEKYGLKDKHLLLGVAYGFGERKGLQDFIQLSRRLKADTVLALVGVNQQDTALLPSNVVAIEKTECLQELVEAYSDADVLLNLTYEDTFPTVNLEALACGTPVITYRTGGSPESLDDTCGVVLEQGDIDGIYQSVQRLREHAFAAQACVNRAQQFDKAKMLDGYKKLIFE